MSKDSKQGKVKEPSPATPKPVPPVETDATALDAVYKVLNRQAQQIAALEKELKAMKQEQPAQWRAFRVTREHIFPLIDAPDTDKDGKVSLEEALANARKIGAAWENERIGIMAEYDY